MTLFRLFLLLVLECALALAILCGGMGLGLADAPAYRAVTLVCPADLPAPDCDRATARDVLATVSVPTPFACMMGGLSTAARAPEPVADGYLKTICEGGR